MVHAMKTRFLAAWTLALVITMLQLPTWTARALTLQVNMSIAVEHVWSMKMRMVFVIHWKVYGCDDRDLHVTITI